MTDSIAIDDNVISVWKKFPTSIRNDPCFAAFREEIEADHGNIQDKFHSTLLIFCPKINSLQFDTTEAYTAQNELLKCQNTDGIKDGADQNGSSQFTTIKHIAFAMIWAFVAWHLLTVKEKNLPKYNIAVDFNQTKSKHLTFKCHSVWADLFILIFHLLQGFNYLYDDFGSKISVNLIGPFAKPTNETGDCMFIYTQIGDSVHDARRFDIKQTGGNQIKPDILTFDIELNDINNVTMPAYLNLSLQITTNANDGVVFEMFIDSHSLDTTMGAICGGIILILLNVLIISEVTTISNGFLALNPSPIQNC